MFKVFSLLAFFVLLTSGGCIWGGQSRETRFFDLKAEQSKSLLLPCEVNFMLFRNLSGADRRFLVRQSGNRLRGDEFNRWLLDPELLLERFLREDLRGKSGPTVRVRGVLTAFEFDLLRKEAVLGIDFTLTSGENSRHFNCRIREKISSGGEDFSSSAAAAMNICATRAAGELRRSITALLQASK